MNIQCKCCHEFFVPNDDALDLLEEGYITSDSCNLCSDCWDLIQLSEFDYAGAFTDADPGL
jgi:hypothetical protein